MENNNNDSNKDNGYTFFKVFKNQFIRNEIYKHVSRYKRNKTREFSSRKQLIECVDRNYIEIIQYSGDDILEIGDFPSFGVLKVIFFKSYSVEQNSNIVPNGVTRILFNQYNEISNTDISKLPPSVSSIIDYMLMKPLDEYSIPNNITFLKFNKKFNQNISTLTSNVFKESLTHLDIGYRFTNGGMKLKKGNFPNSLIKLNLSFDYNYKFGLENGVIPTFGNLKYLNLTCFFNLKNGDIPESVTNLKLCCGFKYNTFMNIQRGFIPKNVLKFELSTKSEIKIENDSLPSTMDQLILNCSVVAPITKEMLPKSLKHLTLSIDNDREFYIENDALPKSIESLYFSNVQRNNNNPTLEDGINNNNKKGWNQIIGPGFLPESLTNLILPNSFNQDLEFTNLNLDSYKLIQQSILNSLKKSYFSTMYAYLLNGTSGKPDHLVSGLILPNNLKKLSIGCCSTSIFNKPILENQLPKSLESLMIGQRKFLNSNEYNIYLENGFNDLNININNNNNNNNNVV